MTASLQFSISIIEASLQGWASDSFSHPDVFHKSGYEPRLRNISIVVHVGSLLSSFFLRLFLFSIHEVYCCSSFSVSLLLLFVLVAWLWMLTVLIGRCLLMVCLHRLLLCYRFSLLVFAMLTFVFIGFCCCYRSYSFLLSVSIDIVFSNFCSSPSVVVVVSFPFWNNFVSGKFWFFPVGKTVAFPTAELIVIESCFG